MTFTLKPDDNGTIVVLTDVDEADISALEKANKVGFDPTESPFDKYYSYDRRIGFFVNKDKFDHAESKGKRLSFDEYLEMFAKDELVNDAEYDPEFVVDRIIEIKMPKDVKSANAALATLNFALFKLSENIDEATEDQKELYHKAINHAVDVYEKANEILAGSEFTQLLDLNAQIEKNRSLSSDAQSKLLSKFHENF